MGKTKRLYFWSSVWAVVVTLCSFALWWSFMRNSKGGCVIGESTDFATMLVFAPIYLGEVVLYTIANRFPHMPLGLGVALLVISPLLINVMIGLLIATVIRGMRKRKGTQPSAPGYVAKRRA